MAEFKGTRGPWKMAGISESGKNHFKVIGTKLGGKYKIARVPFLEKIDAVEIDDEVREAQANAKLIAAAPDLLETLADAHQLISYISSVLPEGKVKKTCDDFLIVASLTIKIATE